MDTDRLSTIAESVDPIVWVILGAIVLILLIAGAVLGWGMARWRRSRHYKQRFGPEYERVRSETGDAAVAEAELERREQRVQQFDIRPLDEDERERFSEQWRRIQTEFVDNPSGSTFEADKLVTQVMYARGYPVDDFEQRAEDLSVDHPRVVENYRSACWIAQRNERGEADTEELRQALVYYRSLFEDLLEPAESPSEQRQPTVEAT